MEYRVPEISNNDYRKYRIISLSNGIKTLLISDIKPPHINGNGTQLAAAALSVNIGSFSDPVEVPGLAHFLEHMVFMGSEKYPDENDYDTYIKTHGGSTNASTDYERTIYQFDVQPEHFEGALDRFSQFFLSPLLRENAVEREIKAVDSEFKETLPSESARLEQLLSHFARKNHPYSKFLWGNSLSLSEVPKNNNVDVMERLRMFFKEYAQRHMALALIAPDSLEILETYARKFFSDIKCRPKTCLEYSDFNNPFELSKFHKLFNVISMKDVNSLDLRWVLPPLQRHYRCSPGSYISWLLGHECKGSIYAELRERGYATAVWAWTEYFSMFSLMNCSVELTEEGRGYIDEVVHIIFQYISMMQRHGPSQDIHKERQQMQDICFNYLDIDEPIDYVEELVDNMHKYEEEDYISGPILLKDFNAKLIEEIISHLTPDTVNIIFSSKTHDVICSEVEPWFETKYAVSEIPSTWLKSEHCSKKNLDLHLPERNRFIGENFELKTYPSWNSQYPQLIHEDEYGKLWFKPDKQFLLPKAEIYFKLVSRIRGDPAYHFSCREMLDAILDYSMIDLTYEAELAELNINTEFDELYWKVSFDGYNKKLQLFFQNAIDKVNSFSFTEKVYNIIKEKVRKEARNTLIKCESFLRTLRLSVLQEVTHSRIDVLRELSNITPQRLRNFAEEFFSEMYIESLFQGNLAEEEVKSYQEYICRHFNQSPLQKKQFPKNRTLKLPLGRTMCRHYGFNKKDPNSAIKNYYQVGPNNNRIFTTAKLLDHIMSEPIFDILRTKEQLGYTVYSDVHVTAKILGFSITVHTEVEKYSADQVDEKICEFLELFVKKMETFTEDEYQKYIDSFVNSLKQADLTLSDEANRNWSEIARGDYVFDIRERMAKEAVSIKKSEVLGFLHKYLIDARTVRMLCVQIIGHHENVSVNGGITSTNDRMPESESDSSGEPGESDSEDDAGADGIAEIYPDCHFKLGLLNVANKRYDYVITDLKNFQKSHEYYSQITIDDAT